jgi:hypothetical protein
MHLCSDMKTKLLLVLSLICVEFVQSSIFESSQVDKTHVKCANLEFDSYYLDFLLIYKDNVKSYDECCEFCNSNTRCVVWTLKVDTGRCYLKYDRGAKLTDTGFVSGFSEKCKLSFLLLDCFSFVQVYIRLLTFEIIQPYPRQSLFYKQRLQQFKPSLRTNSN